MASQNSIDATWYSRILEMFVESVDSGKLQPPIWCPFLPARSERSLEEQANILLVTENLKPRDAALRVVNSQSTLISSVQPGNSETENSGTDNSGTENQLMALLQRDETQAVLMNVLERVVPGLGVVRAGVNAVEAGGRLVFQTFDSLVDCVWKPLRDVGLIAKIYGHDVKDPAVQNLMLWCLLHASGASTFGNVSGASARREGNATPSALETVLAILRETGGGLHEIMAIPQGGDEFIAWRKKALEEAHELFAKSSAEFWVPVATRSFFWILPHFLSVSFFLMKISGKAHSAVDQHISFWPFIAIIFCALAAVLYPLQLVVKRLVLRTPSSVVFTFCALVPALLFFVSANRCAKTGLDVVTAITTSSSAASGSFLERNFCTFFSIHIFLICVSSMLKHVPAYLKAVRNFSSERHDAKLDRIVESLAKRKKMLEVVFLRISLALAVWPVLGLVFALGTSSVSLILASLSTDLMLGLLRVASIRCEQSLLETLLSKHVILYILKPRRAAQAGVGSIGLVYYIVTTAVRNPTVLGEHIECLTPERRACTLVLTIRTLSAPAGFLFAFLFNDAANAMLFDIFYERPTAVVATILAVCVPTLGLAMYARIRNNVECFHENSLSYWRRVFHILPFKVPKLDFYLSLLDAKMNAPPSMTDIRVVLDRDSSDRVCIEWTDPSPSLPCARFQVDCVQCDRTRSWFGFRGGNAETMNEDLTVTEPRATMSNLRDLYVDTFRKRPFVFRVRGFNAHGYFGKWASSSQIWGRFCQLATPRGPVVCGKIIECHWKLHLGIENDSERGQPIEVDRGDFVGIYAATTPVEQHSQYLKCSDSTVSYPSTETPGWQSLRIETPPTYVEETPVAVHFTRKSNNSSEKIVGYYILVQEVINGKPVYRKIGSGAWLRMGPDGNWVIGDTDAKNGNTSAGWCSSSGPAGVHPAKATKWMFHTSEGEKVEQAYQLRAFTGPEWSEERERSNLNAPDASPAEPNNVDVELRYYSAYGILMGRSRPFQLVAIDEPAIAIDYRGDVYKVTITPSSEILQIGDMRYKCQWRRNAILSRWQDTIGMGDDNSTTIRMIKVTDLLPSTEYIVQSCLYFEHEQQEVHGKYNRQTFTTPEDLPCARKPDTQDVTVVQVNPTSMVFELSQPEPATVRYELQWRKRTLMVADAWRPVNRAADTEVANQRRLFPLSELEPDHHYQLQYRKIARNGDCGLWSDIVDFQTLPKQRSPRQAAAPKASKVTVHSAVLTIEHADAEAEDDTEDNAEATPTSPGAAVYISHIPAQTYEVRISLDSTFGRWKALDSEPQQLATADDGSSFVFFLENLDAGSTYLVQARGKAENGQVGQWSETTKFETLAEFVQSLPLPGLPVINSTQTGQSSVNIASPRDGGSRAKEDFRCQLQYRASGSFLKQWQDAAPSNNKFTAGVSTFSIGGLQPGQGYQARARCIISTDDVLVSNLISEWTEVVDFHTPAPPRMSAPMLNSVAENSAVVQLCHEVVEGGRATLKPSKYELNFRRDRLVGLGGWTSMFQVVTAPGPGAILSPIQITLEDLSPAQSYEVRTRSFARTIADDAEGTQQEVAGEWSTVSKFVTLPESTPNVPVLSSVSSTEPTKATAVFTVSMESDSTPPPTCQVEYTTDAEPHTNWIAAKSISLTLGEDTSNGSQATFNIRLLELQPASAYVIRGRATSAAQKSSAWSEPTRFVTMAMPKAVVAAIFPSDTHAKAVVALKCSDPMDDALVFELRFREEAAKKNLWVNKQVERVTSSADTAELDSTADFDVGFLQTGRQSTLTATQMRPPQTSANMHVVAVAAVLSDLKFQTQYLVQARVVGPLVQGEWSADTPFHTAEDPDPRHAKPFIFQMPNRDPKTEMVPLVRAQGAILVLNPHSFSAPAPSLVAHRIVEAQFCGVGWHLAVVLRVKQSVSDAESPVAATTPAEAETGVVQFQAERNLGVEYRANSGMFFSNKWEKQLWSQLPPLAATPADSWRVGDVVEAMHDKVFEPAMIVACPSDNSHTYKVQFVDATRIVSAPAEIRSLTSEVRHRCLVFELSGLKPDTQYEVRACFGDVTCPAATLRTNRISSLQVVPNKKCCDVVVRLHGCQELAQQVTSREDADSTPAACVPCFQIEFALAESPSARHATTITLPHVDPTEIPMSMKQVVTSLRPNSKYHARGRCVRDDRHSAWTEETTFETYTPLGPSVLEGKVNFAWAQVQVSYPIALIQHVCELQLEQRASGSSEWTSSPYRKVSSQTTDKEQVEKLLIDLHSGGEKVVLRARLCFAKPTSDNSSMSLWSKECAIVPPRLSVPSLRLDTALTHTADLILVSDDNARSDAVELDLERLGCSIVFEVEWQSRSMIPLVDYAKSWKRLASSAQTEPGKFELTGLSPGHTYSVRIRRSVAPQSPLPESDPEQNNIHSKWSKILHFTTKAAAPASPPPETDPSTSAEAAPALVPPQVTKNEKIEPAHDDKASLVKPVTPNAPCILAASPTSVHVVLTPRGDYAVLQPLEVECQVKSAMPTIFSSSAWPLTGSPCTVPRSAPGAAMKVATIVDTQICAEPLVFAPGVVQSVSNNSGELVYEVQVFDQHATAEVATDVDGAFTPVLRHLTAAEVRPLSQDTIFSYGIRIISGLTPDTMHNFRSTRETKSHPKSFSAMISHKTEAIPVPSAPPKPELVRVDDTSAEFRVTFPTEDNLACRAANFDLEWCEDRFLGSWTRQQQPLDQNVDGVVLTTVSALSPNAAHLVRVRGRSSEDVAGEWSPQLQFTTKPTESSSVTLTLKRISSCDVEIEGTVSLPAADTTVATAVGPPATTAEKKIPTVHAHSSVAHATTPSPSSPTISSSLKMQLKPRIEFKWKPKPSKSILDLGTKSSRVTSEIKTAPNSASATSVFATVGLKPATTYVLQARLLAPGSATTEPWSSVFEFTTLADTAGAAPASAVTSVAVQEVKPKETGEKSASSASPKASSWASYIVLYNSTDASIKVAVDKDRFYTGDNSYYELQSRKEMKWTRIQGTYKIWIAEGHAVQVKTTSCTTIVVVFPDHKFVVKRHENIVTDVATSNLIAKSVSEAVDKNTT